MSKSLTNEAVFRIELSLSSRRSSAIVMRTQARLYSLDKGSTEAATPNTQWKSLAYGAPCIQLMRETTDHNSPYHIKVVIAEVESGISLWEAEVTENSGYNAMQTNFHTFSSTGKTFAVQFANAEEGQRMLESIHDLFMQKQKAETVAFENKPDQPIFKKPKAFKRLSRKDISAPCNFKHVSGITVQRTHTCEEELRGTIQRKMRSMSLSSLLHPAASGVSKGQEESSGTPATKRSLRHKFGSLRVNKKKGLEEVDAGMSVPSRGRMNSRPPLTQATFQSDRKSPSRSMSLSSSDLVSPRRASGASLERRHTFLVDRDYNYVPYSKATARSPSHDQLNKPVPPPVQLSAHYQVPTKRGATYDVPRVRDEPVRYQPPVRPYAVVGIGSQPNLSTTLISSYDVPRPKQSSQRNKYPNANLRTTRSMSPLKEPPCSEVGPSTVPCDIQEAAFTRQDNSVLASNSSSSMQDSYTDVMAKALQQFDSVLQPTHDNKQIIQTSL